MRTYTLLAMLLLTLRYTLLITNTDVTYEPYIYCRFRGIASFLVLGEHMAVNALGGTWKAFSLKSPSGPFRLMMGAARARV